MNQQLIALLGKTVLGNLWSTSIGGSLMWANFERVAHLMAQNPTIGTLVTASEFQAFVSGAVGAFIQDPKKLPQLFYKDDD